MKFSLVIIGIFIFQFLNAQRFSIIEKNESNSFLFDEISSVNSISLISLAKKMFERDYAKGQVISPEMLDFLKNKGLENELSKKIGTTSFEAVPTIYGEDSLVFDESFGVYTTLVQEVQQIDYFDLNNITQLVIFENLVVDTIQNKSYYAIDKIGFAKRYPELGNKYFITFSMKYSDLIGGNGIEVRLPLSEELNNQLVNERNPTSFLGKLRSLQFEKMKQDSVSIAQNKGFNFFSDQNRINFSWYFPDETDPFVPPKYIREKTHYIVNTTFLPMVNGIGEDSIVVNEKGEELLIVYENRDTTTYWIDLPSPQVNLCFSFGKGYSDSMAMNGEFKKLNEILITSKLTGNLTYSYVVANLSSTLYAESNYSLIKDLQPYNTSNDFEFVKYINEFSKSKHKYYVKGKKTNDLITQNYFVNTYFKLTDPNFGIYFK
jgi:hypothetical protein